MTGLKSIIADVKFDNDKVLEYRFKPDNNSVEITYSDFLLFDEEENWLEYKVSEKEAIKIRERVRKGDSIDDISREYAERLIKEKEAEYENPPSREKYLMLSRREQENSLMMTAMLFTLLWKDMGNASCMLSDHFDSLNFTEKLKVFCDWAREYVYEYYSPKTTVKHAENYLKTRLAK